MKGVNGVEYSIRRLMLEAKRSPDPQTPTVAKTHTCIMVLLTPITAVKVKCIFALTAEAAS